MEPKKNANVDLNKRRGLFLQLGLILVLLLAYFAINWKSYDEQEKYTPTVSSNDVDEEVIPITQFAVKTPPPLPKPAQILKVIDNNEPAVEDKIQSTELTDEPLPEVSDIVEAPKEDPITVPYDFIESVPIFPGCEEFTSNKERKKCMSDKITKFVNSHFNRDLGQNLGLSGINRISVVFKIDTKGNIVDIQSRAPHPKLEEEAKRIIEELPKMKPGKQRGKPVSVSYTLPIVFRVQE